MSDVIWKQKLDWLSASLQQFWKESFVALRNTRIDGDGVLVEGRVPIVLWLELNGKIISENVELSLLDSHSSFT